jgi:hypothetical protein
MLGDLKTRPTNKAARGEGGRILVKKVHLDTRCTSQMPENVRIENDLVLYALNTYAVKSQVDVIKQDH